MNEDKLKESFRKIREDMNLLQQEIEGVKRTLEDIDTQIRLLQISSNQPTIKPTDDPTHNTLYSNTPTHIPTHPYAPEAVKSPNMPISTGNDGVPTNHQTLHPTNHQTLQHPPISTQDYVKNINFSELSPHNYTGNTQISSKNEQNSEKSIKIDKISKLQQVSEILRSLDDLKKEVRIKFKKLTNQEMLIYSTIYQLDELGVEVDYSIIAEKLGLTGISIRDYVRKIISKGIPLDKTKENNKKVLLKIPNNFKKVASLNTILELRQL